MKTLKGTKIEIGDLLTSKGEIIKINDEHEAVLSGKTWYNNITYGAIYPAGESPSARDDVDWGGMRKDVKITARGGSYASEMIDCILEVL